ncbi:hypothetical protein C8Q75DRAFT_764734 [Abortiporus biennis]|nr:hypothetical protein C8Q75DRAFT_764734 [Abortiporus biennis]
MSGQGTSSTERDEQLLGIGKQCSAPLCHLVDFLPFKCQHCGQDFCQEHFMPKGHNCDKYDEYKHNRIAPDCPFCKVPIAIPPGQDPNARLEHHFETDCPVLTGKNSKAKSSPRCARAKCGKVLFSPIRCEKCREQFCPAHRYPDSHSCTSRTTTATPSPSQSSRNLNAASPASAAAMAAIKRTMNSTQSSVSSSRGKPDSTTVSASQSKQKVTSVAAKASTSTPKTTSNPFSATDRRAKAERESKLKAMGERAKKGLLSEQEKEVLAAEEEAMRNRKDDCIIA